MTRPVRLSVSTILAVVLLTVLPGRASAQGMFGIGPRLSFIRGDVTTNTPSQDLIGVLVRIKASPRVALEGSLDYKSTTSTDMTQRVKETPLQVSLLLYPIRTTLSPYVLAGFGVYTETTDTFAAGSSMTSTPLTTTTTRNTGWHAGFGGELAFGQKRHVAAFADYRYRSVQLGNGSPVIPGLNLLKASHQGSMWTGGLVFYF